VSFPREVLSCALSCAGAFFFDSGLVLWNALFSCIELNIAKNGVIETCFLKCELCDVALCIFNSFTPTELKKNALIFKSQNVKKLYFRSPQNHVPRGCSADFVWKTLYNFNTFFRRVLKPC